MNDPALEPAVVAALARPFGTLADMVRLQARLMPDHPALIVDDRHRSYAAFDATIDSLAPALPRSGIGKVLKRELRDRGLAASPGIR
jgi:non-ribosomal peptide synthetase component E (peptide arylation enzyme)